MSNWRTQGLRAIIGADAAPAGTRRGVLIEPWNAVTNPPDFREGPGSVPSGTVVTFDGTEKPDPHGAYGGTWSFVTFADGTQVKTSDGPMKDAPKTGWVAKKNIKAAVDVSQPVSVVIKDPPPVVTIVPADPPPKVVIREPEHAGRTITILPEGIDWRIVAALVAVIGVGATIAFLARGKFAWAIISFFLTPTVALAVDEVDRDKIFKRTS